jgi:glycosyltransferase involved in cell wall biosynthesis
MPASPDPQVSIIVPAYNEASRLPQSLRLLGDYLRGWSRPYEVLVVVEQSTDGTLELARRAVAEQPEFRVIDNQVQRGKGYAVRSGMGQARGAVAFYMDADLSVPLEEMDKFLAWFEAHPQEDVLIGSRQHPGSRIERRQGFIRQSMGRTFNRILRSVSLLPFRDTQCGFKAFRREAAREIFALQTIDGFAFDVEVILLAQGLGRRIRELPVRWLNSTESKVRIVRDSLRMLVDVLVIRRRIGRVLGARNQRRGD